MREELGAVRAAVEEAKQLAKTAPAAASAVLLRGRDGRMRKEYTKHLACPSRQCRSRYSSRIALRAHVRRAHPDLALPDHS